MIRTECAPFPWRRLPQIARREVAEMAALARLVGGAWTPRETDWPPRWPGVAIAGGTPRRSTARALAVDVADRHAIALRLVRDDGAHAALLVPGLLARALAGQILGLPDDELAAPRAVSEVERGVVVFAAAAALHAWDVAGVQVADPLEDPAHAGDHSAPRTGGEDVADAIARAALVHPDEALCAIPLVVSPARTRGGRHGRAARGNAPGSFTAFVAIPAGVLARGAVRASATTLEALLVRRGHRLAAPLAHRVTCWRAAIGARSLTRLRPRDVIALGHRTTPAPIPGVLVAGRGGFRVDVDGDRVMVTGRYERAGAMNEVVADDVTVELACSVGSAEVSARELLELQPGQVLSLARPVGGAVDLVVGRTVIGRGELVDIDGELGVRVLSLAREPADAASTPAGDAASMPAGGATPDGSPNVKE